MFISKLYVFIIRLSPFWHVHCFKIKKTLSLYRCTLNQCKSPFESLMQLHNIRVSEPTGAPKRNRAVKWVILFLVSKCLRTVLMKFHVVVSLFIVHFSIFQHFFATFRLMSIRMRYSNI